MCYEAILFWWKNLVINGCLPPQITAGARLGKDSGFARSDVIIFNQQRLYSGLVLWVTLARRASLKADRFRCIPTKP